MRENKQTNRKPNYKPLQKEKKIEKTTCLELTQINRGPSQPALVFPAKNCMWYGTYLTEIKERQKRNRQLEKGKKQYKNIQRKLQVL